MWTPRGLGVGEAGGRAKRSDGKWGTQVIYHLRMQACAGVVKGGRTGKREAEAEEIRGDQAISQARRGDKAGRPIDRTDYRPGSRQSFARLREQGALGFRF